MLLLHHFLDPGEACLNPILMSQCKDYVVGAALFAPCNRLHFQPNRVHTAGVH